MCRYHPQTKGILHRRNIRLFQRNMRVTINVFPHPRHDRDHRRDRRRRHRTRPTRKVPPKLETKRDVLFHDPTNERRTYPLDLQFIHHHTPSSVRRPRNKILPHQSNTRGTTLPTTRRRRAVVFPLNANNKRVYPRRTTNDLDPNRHLPRQINTIFKRTNALFSR